MTTRSDRLRRIHVVGTAGSGKTTMARQLAQRLAIPHVELDALMWGPNWTQTPWDLFRERVAQALNGPAWTVCGNYSQVRPVIWSRADTVVWLDYSLPLILWRVTSRTLRRCLKGELLWGNNRETLQKAFFDRDSIILYALKTYRRRRKQYLSLFDQPEYHHLNTIQLGSPRQARKWLASMPKEG